MGGKRTFDLVFAFAGDSTTTSFKNLFSRITTRLGPAETRRQAGSLFIVAGPASLPD